MPDIPDKVIEQAAEAGVVAYRAAAANNIPGNPIIERERAFAQVIAAWARAEERERIKRLLEGRAREAADDYHRDPQAYHRGREDELLVLADELDSAGAREDGK